MSKLEKHEPTELISVDEHWRRANEYHFASNLAIKEWLEKRNLTGLELKALRAEYLNEGAWISAVGTHPNQGAFRGSYRKAMNDIWISNNWLHFPSYLQHAASEGAISERGFKKYMQSLTGKTETYEEEIQDADFEVITAIKAPESPSAPPVGVEAVPVEPGHASTGGSPAPYRANTTTPTSGYILKADGTQQKQEKKGSHEEARTGATQQGEAAQGVPVEPHEDPSKTGRGNLPEYTHDHERALESRQAAFDSMAPEEQQKETDRLATFEELTPAEKKIVQPGGSFVAMEVVTEDQYPCDMCKNPFFVGSLHVLGNQSYCGNCKEEYEKEQHEKQLEEALAQPYGPQEEQGELDLGGNSQAEPVASPKPNGDRMPNSATTAAEAKKDKHVEELQREIRRLKRDLDERPVNSKRLLVLARQYEESECPFARKREFLDLLFKEVGS